MDRDEFVVRPGDRAGARGRLVRTARGTWLDPPVPVPLNMMSHPAPVGPPSRFAVPVSGADFSRTAERHELDGDAEGWAGVAGTWTGSELRIDRHVPGRPRLDPGSFPSWRTPPCPPPPGGWPTGGTDYGGNLDFDLGDLRGAAVTVTTFRPGPDQAVLVVAATDPAAVEARLRPQLGPRLCVVPSRWTRHDVDAVRDQLRRHEDDWNIYQSAVVTSEDAQASVTASLTRMLPGIADWAATLPAGLLTLKPWLVPAPAAG